MTKTAFYDAFLKHSPALFPDMEKYVRNDKDYAS